MSIKPPFSKPQPESVHNGGYLVANKFFRKPLQIAENGLRPPSRLEIVGCSGYYTHPLDFGNSFGIIRDAPQQPGSS
ncbi:hypothetical protein [Pleomorphovibrio marinus]|uniref:hypothetical protein n=1 Tax=Pleomorphovibrio marinus TaxID=2164132 RepID=UPI000E0BEDB3|nr:hypothetical protein [Pleomorphovibrio marinus]